MNDAGTALRPADPPRLTCLRWDAAGDEALGRLTDADWAPLMAVIRARLGHHFLARRLDLTGVAAPPWVVEELQGQARAELFVMFQTLARLRACCAGADHPILALKGLDLAHRVYPHAGVRPMSDCDILVPPARVLTMDAVLRNHGYRRSAPLNDTIIMGDGGEHHVLYRPADGRGLPVELHWRLSVIAHGRDGRDADAVLTRAVPAAHRALPAPIHVLPPEDTLLHLCEHIAHHDFETPLTQIWDLAEVVRWAGAAFDWDLFWRQAESVRLVNAARLCLCQLDRTLGVTVPAAQETAPKGMVPAPVIDSLPVVLPNLRGFFRDGNHKDTFKVAVVLNSNRSLADWLAWCRRKTAAPVTADDAPVRPAPTMLRDRLRIGFRFLLPRWRLIRLWLFNREKVHQKAAKRSQIVRWVEKK